MNDNREYIEQLEQFVVNLRNKDFIEAHITMEKQWKLFKQSNHPLTKLLKGYINGATAFELVNRGKESSAMNLWQTYEKYISQLKVGIDGYSQLHEADRLLREYHNKYLS